MENKLAQILKKMAKSSYYQTLYSRSKEMANINLFSNKTDFTYIQVLFLQYLELYNSAYRDMAIGENLTEEVINNDIRLEAYFYCKNRNVSKPKTDNNIDAMTAISKIPSISFVPPKRSR